MTILFQVCIEIKSEKSEVAKVRKVLRPHNIALRQEAKAAEGEDGGECEKQVEYEEYER